VAGAGVAHAGRAAQCRLALTPFQFGSQPPSNKVVARPRVEHRMLTGGKSSWDTLGKNGAEKIVDRRKIFNRDRSGQLQKGGKKRKKRSRSGGVSGREGGRMNASRGVPWDRLRKEVRESLWTETLNLIGRDIIGDSIGAIKKGIEVRLNSLRRNRGQKERRYVCFLSEREPCI